MASTTADKIAKTIEDQIFNRYGRPTALHADNAQNMSAKLMEEVLKELKIKLVHGPSFNAKSNFTERSHKDLNAMLRAVCIQNPNQDWEEQLRSCVHALNTSRNRHTGMTAFYLMYGRECHTPLDHIFGNIPNEPEEKPHEAALRLRQRQQAAYRFVRENLQRAVERTSATYSQTNRHPFRVDQLVWLCTPRIDPSKGKKLSTVYSGPYKITEKIGDVLFRIETHGNWNKRPLKVVVSIDRLSHFHHGATPTPRDLGTEDITMEDEFAENIGPATVGGDNPMTTEPPPMGVKIDNQADGDEGIIPTPESKDVTTATEPTQTIHVPDHSEPVPPAENLYEVVPEKTQKPQQGSAEKARGRKTLQRAAQAAKNVMERLRSPSLPKKRGRPPLPPRTQAGKRGPPSETGSTSTTGLEDPKRIMTRGEKRSHPSQDSDTASTSSSSRPVEKAPLLEATPVTESDEQAETSQTSKDVDM